MYQPMKLPKYDDENRHEICGRQKTSTNASHQRNQHSNRTGTDEKKRVVPGQSREIKKISMLVNWKL